MGGREEWEVGSETTRVLECLGPGEEKEEGGEVDTPQPAKINARREKKSSTPFTPTPSKLLISRGRGKARLRLGEAARGHGAEHVAGALREDAMRHEGLKIQILNPNQERKNGQDQAFDRS